eukprot:3097849-Ditylum_brightwellii.AAC.1
MDSRSTSAGHIKSTRSVWQHITAGVALSSMAPTSIAVQALHQPTSSSLWCRFDLPHQRMVRGKPPEDTERLEA